MGLGFCPDQNMDVLEPIKDINLFVRKLTLKVLHHKEQNLYKGLDTLMSLKESECRELLELLTSDLEEFESLSSSPSDLLQ